MTLGSRKWPNTFVFLGISACVTLSLFILTSLLYSGDSLGPGNHGDLGVNYLVGDEGPNHKKHGKGTHRFPKKKHEFRTQTFTQPGRHRYESFEVWRTPDTFKNTYPLENRLGFGERDPQLHAESQWGEAMQQHLAADFAEGSEKVFLMIKTGADVLWKRLPVHLVTTLTRVPNFALYSDKPGSVGGYEVVDVLENVTQSTLQSNEFTKYRKMKELYSHGLMDPSDVKIDGGWDLDKFKNIPMLAHAYHMSPNSDWFVFQDGDSFMFFDVLTNWLKDLDPNKPLYVGSGAMLGDLLFAHGGSCVVVSRKALELTVGQHPEYLEEYEKKAFQTCCGDALVAQMFKEKINLDMSWGKDDYPHSWERFQGRQHQKLEFGKDEWCSPIVSFHHVTPHDIETLWEYERLKGDDRGKITYADIYRDFYQPYIVEKLDHWDNLARDYEVEYSGNSEKDVLDNNAWESWEKCRDLCQSRSDCLIWRYISDKKYCGLGSRVIFGSPTVDFMGTVDTISGWLPSRIRALRSKQSCDPLSKDSKSEGAPDGSSTDFYEGWYRRRYENDTIKSDWSAPA